jgi:hypothetical protein
MHVALSTELHQLEMLLQHGYLNLRGLQHGYQFCIHPNQVVPGNLSIVRERVLAGFIAALAHETGAPESYWTDRLLIDVPDDPSGLGGGHDGTSQAQGG